MTKSDIFFEQPVYIANLTLKHFFLELISAKNIPTEVRANFKRFWISGSARHYSLSLGCFWNIKKAIFAKIFWNHARFYENMKGTFDFFIW